MEGSMDSEIFEFEAPLGIADSDLFQYYIPVPENISEALITPESKRVICQVEGKLEYQAALISIGQGNYVILLNKERRTKLGLVLGEIVGVRVWRDTSELGMKMSDEFAEVMNQESEALEIFEKLTPGKKRTLIYWSDNVKSSEIKIRRAMVMARHLIETKGAVDFKLLNIQIKHANAVAKRRSM
ncbi:MAG TPA: hypothetical protein DCX14_01025 [Flavobacteriales bacterium]|nr:DUF1905 domain-containing protein [Flavobacteriales bacterium]HAW18740.1 hypothetical protein [Flavobacteriales bacterium]